MIRCYQAEVEKLKSQESGTSFCKSQYRLLIYFYYNISTKKNIHDVLLLLKCKQDPPFCLIPNYVFTKVFFNESK